MQCLPVLFDYSFGFHRLVFLSANIGQKFPGLSRVDKLLRNLRSILVSVKK